MYDSHIVWGDGTGIYRNHKISQYAKRTMETVPELFKKGEDQLHKLKTQQIYFMQDCIVFLMSTGEVFQKGVFSFQNQHQSFINSQDVNQIDLPEKISKVKIGDDHLIFLSKEGNIFTLGDNYYGQLGIDNNMIPRKVEPVLITLPDESKCIDIHAYKNTSFAINSNHELFVWGKSEFIPSLIGNLYAPLHIFPLWKVKSIKHDSDRMIVEATIIELPAPEEKEKLEEEQTEKDEENKEEEEEDNEEKDNKDRDRDKDDNDDLDKEELDKEERDRDTTLEKITEKILRRPTRQSSQILTDYFTRSKRKSTLGSKKSSTSTLKMLSEEEKERNKYNQIRILLKNLKLFNEKFATMMNSITIDEDKQVNLIKDIVANQGKYTFKEANSAALFKIEDLIDKLYTDWNGPQPRKEEDFLTSFFLITMTQTYNSNIKDNKHEAILKQINFQADKYAKDYTTPLARNQLEFFHQKNSINKDERYEKAIVKEFYSLIPYFFKYKKVEALIQRLALHQSILFSYEMNNVRNALEEEMKEPDHSIGKMKIIAEKFGFIESLLSMFNANFKEIDVLYESLPKRLAVPIQNNQGTLSLQSEQYLYKILIQSVLYIGDLWSMLIEKINSVQALRIKQREVAKTLSRFKDVYCTQIYLEKLDFPFPFKKEFNQSIKMNMLESLAQIDGCASHIQKLIDEMINTDKEAELENRKMLIMYASSVLETAKLQRTIWFVLYEQSKAGVI